MSAYLGINLAEARKDYLCSKHYKALLREIKESLNKWRVRSPHHLQIPHLEIHILAEMYP